MPPEIGSAQLIPRQVKTKMSIFLSIIYRCIALSMSMYLYDSMSVYLSVCLSAKACTRSWTRTASGLIYITCVRVCIYIHIHTPIHTSIYIYIYIHTHTYMCMYTRTCMHACMHACMHTCAVPQAFECSLARMLGRKGQSGACQPRGPDREAGYPETTKPSSWSQPEDAALQIASP